MAEPDAVAEGQSARGCAVPSAKTSMVATPGHPTTRYRANCPGAAAIGSSAGRLVEGGVADVCLFDAAAEWRVTPDQLASQGKHTPFAFAATGMALPGRVRATLVAGTVAYEAA